MRRLIKIIGGILLGLLVLAGVTVAGALGYRAPTSSMRTVALCRS